MKLLRYELTIDGVHNIGLIVGGYGLDILSAEDLEELNSTLPLPPNIQTTSKILCFFTQKGVEKFSKTLKIAEKNLKSEKNKLGLRLVVKELDSTQVPQEHIVYQDQWQVHIREPIEFQEIYRQLYKIEG